MRIIFFFIFSGSILFAQTDSTATIQINSNYERARIYLDDHETPYLTPSLIPDVKTGKHKITLRWIDLLNRSEYVAEDSIEVTGKDSNSFWIEFKPVSVTLVCNAEHTKLYINGRLKGEGGDLVLDRIIPGTYNLRLKQSYGLTAEKQVYFPPNSSDCPPECFVFGNLHVDSEELTGVSVFINGIKTDRLLPATFSNLIIGEYEVSAEVKGKLFSKKVVVKADEENYVHINPKQIEAEISEREKAQEIFQKKEIALQKEKERVEKTLKKKQERLRPKDKLAFLIGITAGFNGTYSGKLSGGSSIDHGTLSYGGFIDIPVSNLFYLHNEVRYFPMRYNYKESPDDYEETEIESSYFYDFVLIRKDLKSGIYLLAGGGLGLNEVSKKIKIGDGLYPADRSDVIAWTAGLGFDPSHDFSIEIRFTKSITSFDSPAADINVHPKTISFNAGYFFDIPFSNKN